MAFYAPARVFFYAFAWVAAVVLLGLTGYRVHWTKHNLSDYDPIIVELLVTACLTILFAPISIFQALKTEATRFTSLPAEFLWTGITWVMLLVGGAITTNKWPTKDICEAFPPVVDNVEFSGSIATKQCHILLTIVAFSWITFSALTFAGVAGLMQWASEQGEPATRVHKDEKVAPSQQPPVTV